MFSRIAPTYDRLNRLLSLGRDQAWRRDAAVLLAPPGVEPRRVLDLGAGTGDFAAALLARYQKTRVVLVDFSAPMLERARSKLLAFRDRTDFLLADALRLPFADMAFEGAVCGFSVRNFEDIDRGLREAARVLKPGARLVVLEFFRPSNLLMKLVYALYVGVVVPLVGGGVSGDGEAYAYLPRSARAFDTVEEFKRRLEAAGFRDLEAKVLTFGTAHAVVGTRC